jgi:hypothetical protein
MKSGPAQRVPFFMKDKEKKGRRSYRLRDSLCNGMCGSVTHEAASGVMSKELGRSHPESYSDGLIEADAIVDVFPLQLSRSKRREIEVVELLIHTFVSVGSVHPFYVPLSFSNCGGKACSRMPRFYKLGIQNLYGN